MAFVKLNGDTSGYTIIAAPAISNNNTLTLPTVTDTLVTQNGATLNNAIINNATLNSPTWTYATLTNATLANPMLTNPQFNTATNFTTVSAAPINGEFLPAANTLAFATNNSERLRITGTGNLGIGTTTVNTGNAVVIYGGNLYVNSGILSPGNIALYNNATVTFTDNSQFNTAQSLGPRNRIINGDFRIDQRGNATVYGQQLASFIGTGSASASTTLTISTVTQGQIFAGMLMSPASVSPLTYITAFGTGNSLVGTYTMSNSLTIGGGTTISWYGYVPINAGPNYVVDRWLTECSVAGKLGHAQNMGAVTPPTGFTNYLGTTVVSAYTPGAGDYFVLEQRIEGPNFSDLAWGTASAKTITISFWAYSSIAGVFGGAIRNQTATRSYPFSYTINGTNTWQFVSLTIPGDVTGSYPTSTNSFLSVIFNLGIGTTYAGPPGSWAAANYVGATGTTNIIGTYGANFYITGVQFEIGSVATPFERRQYTTELQLCQRYFQAYNPNIQITGLTNGIVGSIIAPPVSMRTTPTVYVPYTNATYTASGAPPGVTWNAQVIGVTAASATGTISISSIGISVSNSIGFYMFGATWSTATNWIATGPTAPLITASAEL